MTSWTVEGHHHHGIIPNKTRVIIIYPTVDPQVVIVPIVSSIFLFPILAFLLICWLRKMAAKRRQRGRHAHRDDFWNMERSCASIVQRSPPLSIISNGNGSGHGPLEEVDDLDVELATSLGEADRFTTTTTTQLTSSFHLPKRLLEADSHNKNECPPPSPQMEGVSSKLPVETCKGEKELEERKQDVIDGERKCAKLSFTETKVKVG